MWIQLLLTFVINLILHRFFKVSKNRSPSSGKDDLLDVETSDFDAIFAVAARVEKVFGGKAYVGLHIPDADSGTPVSIDIVVLMLTEGLVMSVKNMDGSVSVNWDGSWLCISDQKHKKELIPDPVAEAKTQTSVLQAYFEQRGLSLPPSFFSYKVITSNPKFRTLTPNAFPPQVIQYDQWLDLKPQSKSHSSGWIKGAFRSTAKKLQDSAHRQLQYVISTAPMWDRLELNSSKFLLGYFLEFKGASGGDLYSLGPIKRSKVSRMILKRTYMSGSVPVRQVLYSLRDYRTEEGSGSEWKEVFIGLSTEVVFQPLNSKKVCKFNFSSITSLTLSA